MHTRLAILLFALAWLACATPARAARSYDNCTGFITAVPTTISAPGTWCLKQNVVTAITSGDAITIAADDVTLDCNDFGLDGANGSDSIPFATLALGVHASNRTHVRVRHCTIRAFYQAVLLEGSGSGHIVEDNEIDQNTCMGVNIAGDGSVVRHNRVANTGSTSNTGSCNPTSIVTSGIVDILDNTVVGVKSTGGSGLVEGIRATSGGTAPFDGSIRNNTIGGLSSGSHQVGIRVSSTGRMASATTPSSATEPPAPESAATAR